MPISAYLQPQQRRTFMHRAKLTCGLLIVLAGLTALTPTVAKSGAGSSNAGIFPREFTRTVTMPAGKALFLTLRDVDASSLEAPPFFGATEEEQREVANFFADHIVD